MDAGKNSTSPIFDTSITWRGTYIKLKHLSQYIKMIYILYSHIHTLNSHQGLSPSFLKYMEKRSYKVDICLQSYAA